MFLPHSWGVFHCCGTPPAWAHWREYSDVVEHKHEELLLQRHRSFTQASMKESVSISSWQLRNAGPLSRSSQMFFCGQKCSIKHVPWLLLYIKGCERQIYFHILDRYKCGWRERMLFHTLQWDHRLSRTAHKCQEGQILLFREEKQLLANRKNNFEQIVCVCVFTWYDELV